MKILLSTGDMQDLRAIYYIYEEHKRTSSRTTDVEKTFYAETLLIILRIDALHPLICTSAQWSTMMQAISFVDCIYPHHIISLPHLHATLASYALAAAVEEAVDTPEKGQVSA